MLEEERYGPTCIVNPYRQSRVSGYKIVTRVMIIFTGIHAHWKKQTAQKSKVTVLEIPPSAAAYHTLYPAPDLHRAQSSQILLTV